ncbi:hypothetical protein MMC06_001084 [Schaereria dolodes]|nr:hypothetical protein [Schaereria dolodes]
MLASFSILVASFFAGFAAAQTNGTTFDPSSVPLSMRNSWCNGEINTCGTLCGGHTSNNNCSGTDLTYDCTCSSNNSAPGLQYYMQSLPFFICQKSFDLCIAAHPDDSAGQSACNTTYVCGTLNASDANVATTSSASPSSTGTPTSTVATASSTGTTSPSASATGKSAAIKVGQDYGLGVLVAGLFAVLRFAL